MGIKQNNTEYFNLDSSFKSIDLLFSILTTPYFTIVGIYVCEERGIPCEEKLKVANNNGPTKWSSCEKTKNSM